jgi:N-methylhydantoinase B
MGGGSGAGPGNNGASGVHCHMSNTLNTPVEALEMILPVRVNRYAIRRGSGGRGIYQGGDGLIREIEFLTPVEATILSDRREKGPYGLNGGSSGLPGINTIRAATGEEQALPGKVSISLKQGDTLSIETPGGGGWGQIIEHL